MKKNKSIPVTVISGFLGSGKTTLLQNLLNDKHGMKFALIVNDMASVNIDAKIVKTEEKIVELSNGCICCTLRLDLVEQLDELYKKGGFDYVIIEGTGVAEPLPIAQTFSFPYEDPESGKVVDITKKYHIDTLVTVVDSAHFMKLFKSGLALSKADKSADKADERNVSELLIDQLEFANVIMLNKVDLVSESELDKLESFIRTVNTYAKIYRTKKSQIDFEKVVNTSLYSDDQMSVLPAWAEELKKEHVPETEEYGISSLVFRSRMGFHPERFLNFVENYMPKKLLRTKGIFWMPSRSDEILFLSQAGSSINLDFQGNWWVTDMIQLEEQSEDTKTFVKSLWKEDIGDRHCEIVFIGQDLDKEKLRKKLIQCELTKQEMDDWKAGAKFNDRWPKTVA